ncbi:MAG TPA: methyltransferase [Casimicrobiaceae bacterium]
MSHDARARTMDLIAGCWTTQAIHAAVKLGLVDALAGGSRTAPALASTLGLDARATYRLLRALAGLGICEHRDGDAFALAEAGRWLRSDVPGSLRGFAFHWGDRTWKAFGQLEATLVSGVPIPDSGKERFFSLAERPDEARMFHRSMAGATRHDAAAIVAACDVDGAHDAIDVGGGLGALLVALLKAHPHLTGASADLPYLESDAHDFFAAEGVADRARYAALDFFDSPPPKADAYLLKSVLHDWDDGAATAILRNLRDAMGAHARLLVIERLAPIRAETDPSQLNVLRSDLQMMVAIGGVERTEREYDALFSAAGLARRRTLPTQSPFSVLDVVVDERTGP